MRNSAVRSSFRSAATLAMVSLLTAASATATGWAPYPIYRGEMTSVAVDPSTPATVYVGTRDAGVFKSTDAGDSWQPARSGLSFYPIRSLAIDPATPATIYAGTDFDGVWKSTDGGASWSNASAGLNLALVVLVLVVDPTDTQTVYAGCAGGIGLAVGNVFKSTDGGASWTRADTGIPGSGEYVNGIRALAMDPVDPDLLYAGTTYGGAFRSTDGGATWSALSNGLPSDDGSFQKVDAVATDPHDNHRPFAIVQGLDGGGLYRLDDQDQWIHVSGQYELTGGSHLHFHPSDGDVLYASGGLGGRVVKSSDDGLTWSTAFGHPDSGSVSEIAWNPSVPSRIFAAADVPMSGDHGGVFRTTDDGATWHLSSSGITAVEVRTVAVSPHDPLRLFVGVDSGALMVSSDGGQSWQIAERASYPGYYSLGYEVTDVVVDPADPDLVYVAAHALHLSTDGGLTMIHESMVDNASCVAAGADGTIWVGTTFGDGILLGSGSGPWTAVNNGLPSFGSSLCPILSLAADPGDGDTMWAGTQYGGGIVKTTDHGASWQVMGLTSANFVDAIAVSPNDSDLVLAGAGYSEGGIYRSTDGGQTWPQVLSGVGFVQDFVFHPHDADIVYAATEGSGVLRSGDGGLTWHDYSHGIFYPVLYSIDVVSGAGDDPRLIVGSYGSGTWHRSVEDLSQIFADDFESGTLGAWSPDSR